MSSTDFARECAVASTVAAHVDNQDPSERTRDELLQEIDLEELASVSGGDQQNPLYKGA